MDDELVFSLEASAAAVAAWAGLPHAPALLQKQARKQALVLRPEGMKQARTLCWLPNLQLSSANQILYSFSSDDQPLERRCLIPATSCKVLRKGVPYSFSLVSGDIFAIGAVCVQAPAAASYKEEGFSIITVSANSLLAPLFSEHPLIIDTLDYQTWLSPYFEMSLPKQLVKPLTASQLKRWQLGSALARA